MDTSPFPEHLHFADTSEVLEAESAYPEGSNQSSIEDDAARKGFEIQLETTRLQMFHFEKENRIKVCVLSSVCIRALRLTMVGQMFADLILLAWVGYTHFRDPSEWLLSNGTMFWLTMYTLSHIFFVGCFLCKLFNGTKKFNYYLKLQIFNSVYLATEILQFTAFFFVHFPPGGTVQTWETITLLAVNGSRLLGNITISIGIGNCTVMESNGEKIKKKSKLS